jgi:hypothetical protein
VLIGDKSRFLTLYYRDASLPSEPQLLSLATEKHRHFNFFTRLWVERLAAGCLRRIAPHAARGVCQALQ